MPFAWTVSNTTNEKKKIYVFSPNEKVINDSEKDKCLSSSIEGVSLRQIQLSWIGKKITGYFYLESPDKTKSPPRTIIIGTLSAGGEVHQKPKPIILDPYQQLLFVVHDKNEETITFDSFAQIELEPGQEVRVLFYPSSEQPENGCLAMQKPGNFMGVPFSSLRQTLRPTAFPFPLDTRTKPGFWKRLFRGLAFWKWRRKYAIAA